MIFQLVVDGKPRLCANYETLEEAQRAMAKAVQCYAGLVTLHKDGMGYCVKGRESNYPFSCLAYITKITTTS
jgi:hypothetical protein